MKRTVVFHRRVQKKLRTRRLPREQVAKCVRLLSEGQTDHLGLRMKRLKGIDRPVFEARVNDHVRLIFTVQPVHRYDKDRGDSKDHLVEQLVVWDVDHHDDALNAARRISYDTLREAEHLNLTACLHPDGVLEEIRITNLPEYPTVPVSVVEGTLKTGKGVLNQYVRLHYRGEKWWNDQAEAVEEESLYDAQEFVEIDLDRIEEEIERIARSDEDFLLHLLPEQMKFVRMPGPLLLSGTVGSGKTTIMLYHLYRQARANPAGRYLVVTYSPTLTALCRLLFEHLPQGKELLGRVDVLSYEELLRLWFPDAQIVSYAERRKQFHAAYQRAKDAWRLGNLKEPLKSLRKQHKELPWDEETLWSEYWDVVKGQLNWHTRDLLDKDGYLQSAESDFSAPEREAVFAAIDTWFRLDGQDELDLSRDLWEKPDRIRHEYEGVYVDEIQDLCEVQWMLLVHLVTHPAGLFLTGDPFQALRPSGFHWRRLQSRLSQATEVQEDSLQLNLRNSRQIAQFVQRELERVKSAYHLDQMPDYHVTALLDGLPPVATDTRQLPVDYATLARWLSNQGAVVLWDEQDRETPFAQKMQEHGALLCTVDEAKGLEFDRVILYRVYSGMEAQMKGTTVLRQHAFSRLYVALTRARRGLFIVEDREEALPSEVQPLSKEWLEAWEGVEPVTVRSCEALRTGGYLSIAEALRRAGQYGEAAEYYELAGRHTHAADCYEQAKDYANAGRCFEQANDDTNAARCYEKAQDFAAAGRCYERSGEWQKAAECYERAGEYAKAAECYEKAGDYLKAGECYERTGDYAAAGRCYEQIREWEKAARCFLKAGDYAAAGRCYEQIQEWEKAARCFLKAGDHAAAGRCYEQIQEWEKAVQCFLKAGDDAGAGRCYEQLGKWQEAAECYEKAGEYASAGRCYEQLGEWEKAGECFGKAGQYAKAGECYEKAKQYHNAARCYDAANLFAKSAWCYEKMLRFTEAGERYEKAQIFDRAAQCYEQDQLFLRAAECYDKAKQFKSASRCRGRAAEKRFRWLEAAQHYERAEMYNDAARCYRAAGRYQDAQRCEQLAQAPSCMLLVIALSSAMAGSGYLLWTLISRLI